MLLKVGNLILRSLKFRLTYIFITIAIGIIAIFFGNEIRMAKEISDRSIIPISPDIKSTISSPTRSELVISTETEETFRLQNKQSDKVSLAPPKNPSMTSEGIPVAWVLKIKKTLGRIDAINLSKKLLSDGHRAFIRELNDGDVTSYYVYLGPNIIQQTLLNKKKSLTEKYSLDFQLMMFEP
jgi:cell division septation protein DedD